jgi:hypothetical protein
MQPLEPPRQERQLVLSKHIELLIGEDGLRKPRPRLARLMISAHAQLRSRGEVFAILV